MCCKTQQMPTHMKQSVEGTSSKKKNRQQAKKLSRKRSSVIQENTFLAEYIKDFLSVSKWRKEVLENTSAFYWFKYWSQMMLTGTEPLLHWPLQIGRLTFLSLWVDISLNLPYCTSFVLGAGSTSCLNLGKVAYAMTWPAFTHIKCLLHRNRFITEYCFWPHIPQTHPACHIYSSYPIYAH